MVLVEPTWRPMVGYDVICKRRIMCCTLFLYCTLSSLVLVLLKQFIIHLVKGFVKEFFDAKRKFHWQFVSSIERPRVVHAAISSIEVKENLFAQVVVRLNINQVSLSIISLNHEIVRTFSQHVLTHVKSCKLSRTGKQIIKKLFT